MCIMTGLLSSCPIDQYMKTRKDIEGPIGPTGYIYYYPECWKINDNLRGRLTIFNRSDEKDPNMRIIVDIEWDDMNYKKLGKEIAKYYKEHCQNFNLDRTQRSATGQSNNNKSCSCGFKPYMLINDKDKETKNMKESESVSRLIVFSPLKLHGL